MVLACGLREARAQELLVSNFFSNQINRYSLPDGAQVGSLGGPINGPLCAKYGPDGDLYVASEGNDSILRYRGSDLSYVGQFVTPGSGGLDSPTGVAWGPDGNMYVSSFSASSVLKYNGRTGAFLGTFVTSGLGGLSGADNGMTFGPDGNLYVPSYNNSRVMRYNGVTGANMGPFIPAIVRPRVLEFRGDSLFITTEAGNTVHRFDAATGGFLGNFITPGLGGLFRPVGMAFADGLLYVGSTGNNQILKYDAQTGAFVGVFASGPAISGPTFLTVVPSPGAGLLLCTAAGVVAGRRRRGG
jgi:DNA-binding beta-propeller fold protein YncE